MYVRFDFVVQGVSVFDVLMVLGWDGNAKRVGDGYRLAGPFSSRGINAEGKAFHVTLNGRAWFDHARNIGGNVIALWRAVKCLPSDHAAACDLVAKLGRDDIVRRSWMANQCGKGAMRDR